MTKIKVVFINLVALLLFIADRLLKIYLIRNPNTAWDFKIFDFHLWLNPGIAFGLQLNPQLINILIPVIAIIILLLVFYLIKEYRQQNLFLIFFLTLLLLGAISNLIDRFLYDAVIDYWDCYFWPIFNLADIMIVVGATGWLIKILNSGKPKRI